MPMQFVDHEYLCLYGNSTRDSGNAPSVTKVSETEGGREGNDADRTRPLLPCKPDGLPDVEFPAKGIKELTVCQCLWQLVLSSGCR